MSDIFDQSTMNPTFIFVDGSYFCFYRYYALINWWKNAYPDEELNNPIENTIFVEKFKKLFIENLERIPKKLKLDKKINPIIIVGKDCKREKIWRNSIYPQYKATRLQDEKFMGGPFFKMAYEDKLFQQGGVKAILQHPELEGDDCIALSVKYIIQKYSKCQIYIITSDKDYLQLASDNIYIYNLAYKNISESMINALHELELKIIMGDVSDNIPSVFPKCGPKTAKKCIEDPNYFKNKMANNKEYYNQYELNKKLICFDFIPENLKNDFILSLQK